MQIISKDQRVTSDTRQDLNDFNLQSVATQDKKGKQIVSMMPAIKRAFKIMDDDIVKLSTEIYALKVE